MSGPNLLGSPNSYAGEARLSKLGTHKPQSTHKIKPKPMGKGNKKSGKFSPSSMRYSNNPGHASPTRLVPGLGAVRY